MRLTLTVKFVVGSLVVAGATFGLPQIIRAAGIDFSTWGSLFVALGVGGAIGFSLSRMLGQNFSRLRDVTSQICEGNLSAEIGPSTTQWLLRDETDDLLDDMNAMIDRLGVLVAHVQNTAGAVTSEASELRDSIESVRHGTEGITATISEVAGSVEQQQSLIESSRTHLKLFSKRVHVTAF